MKTSLTIDELANGPSRYISSGEIEALLAELEEELETLEDEVLNAEREIADIKESILCMSEDVDNGEHTQEYADARIEELEEDLEDAEGYLAQAKRELEDWHNEDGDDFEAFKQFVEECRGYFPDWRYGTTLIHESEFEDYAYDYAHDIGAIGKNSDWISIDWETTADNLKQDFTSIEFMGETFYGN